MMRKKLNATRDWERIEAAIGYGKNMKKTFLLHFREKRFFLNTNWFLMSDADYIAKYFFVSMTTRQWPKIFRRKSYLTTARVFGSHANCWFTILSEMIVFKVHCFFKRSGWQRRRIPNVSLGFRLRASFCRQKNVPTKITQGHVCEIISKSFITWIKLAEQRKSIWRRQRERLEFEFIREKWKGKF